MLILFHHAQQNLFFLNVSGKLAKDINIFMKKMLIFFQKILKIRNVRQKSGICQSKM